MGILRSGSLALLPTGQYRRWKSGEKESDRIGGKGVSPLAMEEGFGANRVKPSRGARERKKMRLLHRLLRLLFLLGVLLGVVVAVGFWRFGGSRGGWKRREGGSV